MRASPGWLGLLALLATAGAGGPCAAAPAPGDLVVLDALSDLGAGPWGGCMVLRRADPPGANTTVFAADPGTYYLTGIAFLPGGDLVLADREADPSGFDPSGALAPGALYRVNGSTGVMSLLADGSNFPGLPGNEKTVFREPSSVAVEAAGAILVTDLDANPSGLPPDPNGYGPGALLRADPATGQVTLVADGSDYPAGLPGGEATIFADPVSVTVAPGGVLYLLDAASDPLSQGRGGAIFRVDGGTGEVVLVSQSSLFNRPADLAVLPDGRIAVADAEAGGDGAVLVVDPANPDPLGNAEVLVTDPAFRHPVGIDAAPCGWLFVADDFANPLGRPGLGAVFEVRPLEGGGGDVFLASSSNLMESVQNVAVVPPAGPAPAVTGIVPPGALQGDAGQVTVSGGGFLPGAVLELGPGIAVTGVAVPDPSVLTADIAVALGAPAGGRTVRVVNPDLQASGGGTVFTVNARPAPVLDSVIPDRGARGEEVAVTLSGREFQPGMTADFGPGIAVNGLDVGSPVQATATLALDPGAALGSRDVTVRNPDGLSHTLAPGFTVEPGLPPAVTRVTPGTVLPGDRGALLVEGDHFPPDATVSLGAGLLVISVTWLDATRLEAYCFVPRDASPGGRDVSVGGPGTGTGVLPQGLLVAGAPVFDLATLRVLDRDLLHGNGNGFPDPGETFDLVPTFVNHGNADSAATPFLLELPGGALGVSVVTPFSELPGVAVGTAATRTDPPHLRLRLAPGVPCGTEIPLRFTLSRLPFPAQVLDASFVVGEPGGLSPVVWVPGAAPGDAVGASVLSAGEMDGEPGRELAIGAPGRDAGPFVGAGRVTVYASGGTLLHVFEGGSDAEGCGTAIGVPGDSDGDAWSDLALGCPGAAGGGRVDLFSGATGAILRSAWGDAPGDLFGAALAAIGDADGDTIGDLAAGAPGASPAGLAGAGVVRVLSGADLSEIARFEGGAGGDALGAALSPAGDLDGDGFADLLAGAPGADAGTGKALALSPRKRSTLLVVDGEGPGERFGSALAVLPDASGDGLPDILVAAPHASPGGMVSAGRTGLHAFPSGARVRAVYGGAPGDGLGTGVRGVPDADGDGLSDFLVTAPGAVRIHRFSGATGDLLGTWTGTDPEETLAILPDRSGDGHPDIMAGAPGSSPFGRIGAGAFSIYHSQGSCEGFVPCADDAREENDTPGEAAPLAFGEAAGGLVLCRGDADWFLVTLPADGVLAVQAEYDPGAGDLSVALYDPGGDLLAFGAGSAGIAQAGGETYPAGDYRVAVTGGAAGPVPYALRVADPGGCVPTREVSGLRVEKGAGGILTLRWEASRDFCHGRYAVFAGPSPVPGTGPPAFPANPPFADITVLDRDGSPEDPVFSYVGVGPLLCYLVVDTGVTGLRGPSGHYGDP